MPEKFVLRSTLTSPFGRKVRMAAEVLGLMDRITLVPADPRDETDTLRQQNPLGKMPCLIAADGTPIYDSGVIIEYLDQLTGGGQAAAGGRARAHQGADAGAAGRRHHRSGDPGGL